MRFKESKSKLSSCHAKWMCAFLLVWFMLWGVLCIETPCRDCESQESLCYPKVNLAASVHHHPQSLRNKLCHTQWVLLMLKDHNLFSLLLRKAVSLSIVPHTKKAKKKYRKRNPPVVPHSLSGLDDLVQQGSIYNNLTAEKDIGR